MENLDRQEINRLKKLLDQKLDDLSTISLLLDPDQKNLSQSTVWIANQHRNEVAKLMDLLRRTSETLHAVADASADIFFFAAAHNMFYKGPLQG